MYHLKHFVLFVILTKASTQETVKVSIYYESLCPDSINFIANQFYPSYKKLPNNLNIDFVPYGFATRENINGTWQFKCQHGIRECYGNMIQACALNQKFGESKDVEYVNCIMDSSDPAAVKNAIKCASNVGVSWSAINECATDGEGVELLVHYGERTESVIPKIKFVPTVIFNDVFNQTLQDESIKDFFSTVCQLFENKPNSCLKNTKVEDIIVITM